MNKSKRAYSSHNSRAIKVFGLVPDFTFEQFGPWYAENFGRPCQCGAKADSIDHVIPLARGGLHSLSNLRLLCRSCNSRKAAWLDGEARVYPWQKPGFKRYRGPKKRRIKKVPKEVETIEEPSMPMPLIGLFPEDVYVLRGCCVYYRHDIGEL